MCDHDGGCHDDDDDDDDDDGADIDGDDDDELQRRPNLHKGMRWSLPVSTGKYHTSLITLSLPPFALADFSFREEVHTDLLPLRKRT